ncbi:hypothetical protein HMPREF9135_1003 [Segatella baroniae F0067]|uniref:Uncharacterized protein n=1 Tax=Segatella baroniae F0067 TaxID=1115809 RepID=U2NJ90_9BACT|nr:hypothetical protein HMPREF9135_1003 [Segatella baroniae F0067]
MFLYIIYFVSTFHLLRFCISFVAPFAFQSSLVGSQPPPFHLPTAMLSTFHFPFLTFHSSFHYIFISFFKEKKKKKSKMI